jgi:hypothetical protein
VEWLCWTTLHPRYGWTWDHWLALKPALIWGNLNPALPADMPWHDSHRIGIRHHLEPWRNESSTFDIIRNDSVNRTSPV